MENIQYINIEDKKATVSFKMNAGGTLYLGELSVSERSLMDAIALAKEGLKEVFKILSKYNTARENGKKTEEKKKA